MSKMRLAFALVVAAFAVSLVGVASASAVEMLWLWLGGTEVLAGQETIKAKTDIGDFVLLAEPLGIKTEILCEEAITKGGWVGLEKLALGELGFNKCVVNKPAGCKVKQPIEFNVEGELLEELPWILFNPDGGGKVFVSLTLEGCLVAGTYNVEGDQECEIFEGLSELKLHEVLCDELRSLLSVGGLPAGFEGIFDVETAEPIGIS